MKIETQWVEWDTVCIEIHLFVDGVHVYRKMDDDETDLMHDAQVWLDAAYPDNGHTITLDNF